MKKVVIVGITKPGEFYGVNTVILTHAKELKKKGYDVSIFCRDDIISSGVYEGIRYNTYKHKKIKNSILKFIINDRQCRKGWRYHYKNKNIDIIHAHDYFSYFSLIRSIGRNVKKVFTIHDPLVYHLEMSGNLKKNSFLKKNIYSFIENYVHRKSDNIQVISKYTKDRCLIKDLPTKTVHHWVDMNKFKIPNNKKKIRRELGIEEDVFFVFTVRSLNKRMGLDRLIVAFNDFNNKEIKSQLRIAGTGPLENELKNQIKNIKNKKIKLLGRISDEELVKYYQAADLVVMPSLDGEGFGLPIIEAMACGTPVIGTPVGAIPEILDDYKSLILEGDRSENILDGINKIYDLWSKDKIKPDIIREYVEKKFNKENLIKLILEDYSLK